jgi:hypothetical protein
MRFIASLLIVSLFMSPLARADVFSKSGEDLLLKITLNESKTASKFELCNAAGESCRQMGNREWYDHKFFTKDKLLSIVAMMQAPVVPVLVRRAIIRTHSKWQMVALGVGAIVTLLSINSGIRGFQAARVMRSAVIEDRDVKTKRLDDFVVILQSILTGTYYCNKNFCPGSKSDGG